MNEDLHIKEKRKACIWMIKHYMKLAKDSFHTYNDICDAYLVYDHYMMAVEKYENLLDELY